MALIETIIDGDWVVL